VTITRVVGFDLRIPKHFSLHFHDFSTILYGIYKFAVFENKRKRKPTFAYRPLEVLVLLTGGPWRTLENRGGISAWFPARFGTWGEGKVGVRREGTEPHLGVSLVRGEKVRDVGSTGAGRQRRSAPALRRFGGRGRAVEGSVSFRGRSWSDSRAQFGRRETGGGSSAGAGRRRPWGVAAAVFRRLWAAVSGLGGTRELRGTRSRGWLESREDKGGAPRGGRGRRRSWRATAALDAVGGPAWRL